MHDDRFNYYVVRDSVIGPTTDWATVEVTIATYQAELGSTVNFDVELGSTVEFDVAHG